MTVIIRPKTSPTPTCVTWPPESLSIMIAPHPAKTRPKVPMPSARYGAIQRTPALVGAREVVASVFPASISLLIVSPLHRTLLNDDEPCHGEGHSTQALAHSLKR